MTLHLTSCESDPFDARELGTILAALRLWQETSNRLEDHILADIAGDNPLTNDEIDALCERLNR